MAIVKFSNGQQVKFNGTPTQADIEEVAKKLGVNNQNKNKQPASLFNKLSNIGEKILNKPSQFLFGSTGKIVGDVITRGIGGGQQIMGQITGNEQSKQRGLALQQKSADVKKSDVAFMALELYPGGGFVSNALKKIPGGMQTIKYLEDTLSRIPKAIGTSAVKDITKVLSPTTKATKSMTAQVAPDLARKKVFSLTTGGLLKRSQAELAKVGDVFDDVLSTIDGGKEFKIAPLKETLEKIKSSAYVKNRAGDIKIGASGKPIAINNNIIKNIDELQSVLDEFGDNISFDSMRSLRQILDKEIAQSGGFLKTLKEGAELDIKKSLSNAIRNILADESPALAKLNAEYTFWKKTADILKATKERQIGKGISIGAKATAIGGLAGGGLKWAVLAPLFEKVFTSTAWRTSSAILKINLADAISSGNTKRVLEVLKRLGVGIKNTNINE